MSGGLRGKKKSEKKEGQNSALGRRGEPVGFDLRWEGGTLGVKGARSWHGESLARGKNMFGEIFEERIVLVSMKNLTPGPTKGTSKGAFL